MKKHILFIMNPIAGGGHDFKRIGRIISNILLKDRNCEYEIRITSGKGDATHIAREASNKDYDVIAAVGGDGTVNEVATGLIGSDVPLGIVPIGSGDGIARGLGIPLALRGAIRTLYTGNVKEIDAGTIGNRNFFATTGFGFDAVVGKLFDEGSIRGPLPYFYHGIREFFNYKPKEYILRFNGKEYTKKALIVAVANTKQFGNGAMIAPFAKPDDGLLDICLILDVDAFNAIIHLPKLFTGQLSQSDYYEFYQTKEVEIVRPGPAPLHVDGEPIDGEQTIMVGVCPRALKVMLPLKPALNVQIARHIKEGTIIQSLESQIKTLRENLTH